MEWYNSGNSTLRTLALSAYTEDELKFNLKYINSKVCNTCFCTNIPANEAEKYNTLTDTVQYAGVVYFRNQEDAIKAVKILGKRVKSLFD